MTPAERVRHLRRTLGMSMGDLARDAGVNRDSILRAERGEQVTLKTLQALLSALDRIAKEAGIDTGDETVTLDMVIFGVLADYSSDMEWIDEVGAKLSSALRESGLLR